MSLNWKCSCVSSGKSTASSASLGSASSASGASSSSSSSSSSSGQNNRGTPAGSPASNANVSCVICSERYKAADNIYAGTCGHVFHWACLQRWWEQSKKCPICRSTKDDYFQIYLNFEETTLCQSESTQGRGVERDNQFQSLLYEAELYRDEIDYLNARIRHLKMDREIFSIYEDSD